VPAEPPSHRGESRIRGGGGGERGGKGGKRKEVKERGKKKKKEFADTLGSPPWCVCSVRCYGPLGRVVHVTSVGGKEGGKGEREKGRKEKKKKKKKTTRNFLRGNVRGKGEGREEKKKGGEHSFHLPVTFRECSEKRSRKDRGKEGERKRGRGGKGKGERERKFTIPALKDHHLAAVSTPSATTSRTG